MKKLMTATLLTLAVCFMTGCKSNSENVLNDDSKLNNITTANTTQASSSTNTQDELLAQIDSLQSDIKDLQNELAKVTSERDKLKAEALLKEETATVQEDDVVVEFIDKINIPSDSDKWRFNDRVEFEFTVTNNTDKAIRGVQGTVEIKDIFGVSIMRVSCDVTGYTIEPNETLLQEGVGLDINKYIDEYVKLYLTSFEDLIFEYTVTQIVFADGTSKTL